METSVNTIEKEDKRIPEYFTQYDIYAAREQRGLLLDITKKYDAEYFWNDLGEAFFKKFEKQEHVQNHIAWILDRLRVVKPKTLLDVGCGFGRVLPFLLNAGVIESAHGVDIANNILELSKKYLEPSNKKLKDKDGKEITPPDFRDKITFQLSDVRKLDLESNSYDCVLTCELLQHLPPEDISQACLELTRVTKKSIICIERWAFPGEHAEPHLWSHNLVDEFKKLGLEIKQAAGIGSGVQGLVVFKRG